MLSTLFQIRLLFGLVPVLGVVLWMGMDSGAKHYEKSPREVRAAIAAAHVPTHILGQYVKGSRVSTPDDRTIITALIDENGRELMRFVTTVTADGTGSEVTTEVAAPQGAYAARAADAMQKQKLTMALMGKLADEHVASAIEGRPFDILAMNPAVRSIADATGYGETFDEASADAALMAEENQQAYAAGGSREDREPEFGEPMTDAAPDSDWGNAN